MRIEEHLDALQREGDQLAAAIDHADPGAPVPSCPKWMVRDLVRHIGKVHRWAAAQIREARGNRIDSDELNRLIGPLPDDAGWPDWFRDGHAQIVAALRAAPEDLQCWTFIPVASPRAFWARRQAHETAIHRFDAQLLSGKPDSYPAAFAADGIDELLVSFVPRRAFEVDPPLALHVHATDTDQHWTVHIGPSGSSASREPTPAGAAGCTVSGPAGVLYPLLWNRLGADAATVTGDAQTFDRWQRTVVI